MISGRTSRFRVRHIKRVAQFICLSMTFVQFHSYLAGQSTQHSSPDTAAVHAWRDASEFYPDLEYAKPDGYSLTLDLYVPKHVSRPVPLVIYIHGGGWLEGDKKNYPMAFSLLLSHGYAVASINYRLSEVAIFPAQIYDAKASVRWLRAHAAQYGLDPNRFGAWGDSAGGHLTALLGTTAGRTDLDGNEGNQGISSAIQAACDFYGPSNLLLMDEHVAHDAVPRLLGGSIQDNQAKARAASPLFYVDSHASPFLIEQGDSDAIVPVEQSLILQNALQKSGVPSKLHVLKGGRHAFLTSPDAANGDSVYLQNVVTFFDHYVKGK